MSAPVGLVDRMEARWRDMQAAWMHLMSAKVDRKSATDKGRARVREFQEQLEGLLRDDAPSDPAEHMSACHTLFLRVESAKRKLDSERKYWDSIIADREAEFETLLHNDQLPLFGDADIALVGTVELDERLVKPSELLYVRGRGAATVVGFRTLQGSEVVVLRDEKGATFEAIPAVLSRSPLEVKAQPEPAKPKPKVALRVGDRVKTPLDQRGTLVRIDEREWGDVGIVALEDDTKTQIPLGDLTRIKKS